MAPKFNDVRTEIIPRIFEDWLLLDWDRCLDSDDIKQKTELKQKDYLASGRYPVVDQGQDFISGYIDNPELIHKGELPVIIFGDHTRAIKYIDFPFAIGADGCKLIQPLKIFDKRFFYYYLKSLNIISEGYSRHYKFLKTIQVPLPPFPEQKRIVEKLDTILPKVKSVKARLDKIPRILKRFRQSVLAAACSGKLTDDWREENPNCGEWKSVFLKDVALSRLGKMLDQSKNSGNPTPYLRNTNVRWFDFDLRNVFTMKTTKEELPELWIKKGDVLICEGGEPGRCAIWQGADKSYIFQKALHRVRVGDTLLGKWLCFNIRDAADSGKLEGFFTGTTIKHLTGVMLKKFDFSLPSLEEQQEIVRRVEKLFKLADSLEAKYKKALTRVEKIEQSILAKAFRGELAPQNPDDEPAEELLKRILAEKAKLESIRKKSKTKH